jgi:hypothetical protein
MHFLRGTFPSPVCSQGMGTLGEAAKDGRGPGSRVGATLALRMRPQGATRGPGDSESSSTGTARLWKVISCGDERSARSAKVPITCTRTSMRALKLLTMRGGDCSPPFLAIYCWCTLATAPGACRRDQVARRHSTATCHRPGRPRRKDPPPLCRGWLPRSQRRRRCTLDSHLRRFPGWSPARMLFSAKHGRSPAPVTVSAPNLVGPRYSMSAMQRALAVPRMCGWPCARRSGQHAVT